MRAGGPDAQSRAWRDGRGGGPAAEVDRCVRAERWALGKVRQETHVDPSTVTVGEYLTTWVGVPVKVVSERLGHAQVTATLAIHDAHVLPGDDAKVAAKVAATILTA